MATITGQSATARNSKLRVANDEIEHLAKVAERERIARDLHDVLGHTLSLITLKSELARKLVDRDPERAKQEMQDVENASRAALADVREAIRGYRSDGIFAELARARAALETAGVSVECDTDLVQLSPEQESVLSLALREAVTNVVRHAEARRCNVTLKRDDSLCTLEVADDGRGVDWPGRQRTARHARAPRSPGRLAPPAHLQRNPPDYRFASRLRRLRSAKLRACPAAKRDKIRVVIAEDQAMVLGALAALLEMEDDIEVVARARSGDEALRSHTADAP